MRRLLLWLVLLLGVAMLIAAGAFGPRYAPALWAAMAFMGAVIVLGLAVLCAVYRRGERRAFWIGFAAFGTGYLLLTMGPGLGPAIGSHFVTSKLMLAAFGVAGTAQQAAELKIRQALDKPVDFEFDDTQLDAVAESIEKDYGINVELDRDIIEYFGSDAPVTYAVHGITLRSALALMLKQIDCTYRINHESLIILTEDAAEDIDYGYRGIIPAMVELTPAELLRGGHSLFALLLALIGGLAARQLYLTREPKPATPDRPRRRWYQFRLRTLLIATALIAIVLAWYTSGPQRQRRAVAAIRSFDGYVQFDYRRNQYVPRPLLDWVGEEYFAEVTGVSYEWNRVDDSALEPLEDLRSLQNLVLSESPLTDVGLARLERLSSLQTLNLRGTPISDASLEHLQHLKNLQELYLSETKITDAGLVHLAAMPQLRGLYLRGTLITDAGVQQLGRLSQLRTLDLSDTKITDAGLQYVRSLTALRQLDLTGTNISDAGMADLEALTNLQSFDVFGTRVTAAQIQSIKGAKHVSLFFDLSLGGSGFGMSGGFL